MYQIQIVLIIFILILFASAYPILDLKYHNDLYAYTDKFNTQCYKEKHDKEKNTYLWKISNYLHDFNNELLSVKDDIKDKDRFLFDSLKYMKIYHSYLNSSVGQLIFFVLFVIIYGFVVFRSKYAYQEWFHLSLFLFMMAFATLFIIIFSLILKKITEIYNDTHTLEYLQFMKKLDLVITYYLYSGADDTKISILKTLYDASYDPKSYDKIYNVENLVLTEDILYKLEGTYTFSYTLNGKPPDQATIQIVKTDIDNYFFRYHQKKHKEDIQYRINVVASYLYAYLVFLLCFLILLFKSIDNYYIYPIIMIALFIAISVYFVYVALR
jgi:hypothetical protein